MDTRQSYQVSMQYSRHSWYLATIGPTLDAAHKHLNDMLTFYDGYQVGEATISLVCPGCTGGKVHKCRSPKRHSNGYHGERCYKTCPVCKGNNLQLLYNALTG